MSVAEYECLMSFQEWYTTGEYEIIGSEFVVESDTYDYAGTVDIKAICKSDGKKGIIDVKTRQNIWPEYELQVSAYANADWQEDVEWRAILQVAYKRNKYKTFKFTEIDDKFSLFLAARQIWAEETAGVHPLQRDYPLAIQIPSLKPVEKVV